MRVTKRQLRKMIREEIEVMEYPELKGTTDIIIDHEFPAEVEAQEDSWAGGQNIQHQLDHGAVAGVEPGTRGTEILKIVERVKFRRRLKKKIRKLLGNS